MNRKGEALGIQISDQSSNAGKKLLFSLNSTFSAEALDDVGSLLSSISVPAHKKLKIERVAEISNDEVSFVVFNLTSKCS
jgi:hypothetical protein